MPTEGTVISSVGQNSLATRMVPYIANMSVGGTGASYGTYPKAYCTRVMDQLGPQQSEAQIFIPLDSKINEISPSVAGVNGNASKIKIGSPAYVQGIGNAGSVEIFTGSVIDISHNLKSDTIIIDLACPKYDLEAIQFLGSFWIDNSNTITYREVPLSINPGGMPNMARGSDGFPYMCPTNWNLADGEEPKDVLELAPGSVKAGYGTTKAVLQYMQNCFSTTNIALARASYPAYPALPPTVNWYSDFADIINNALQYNGSGGAAFNLRKGRTGTFDGVPILTAINQWVEGGGPFTVAVLPDIIVEDSGATDNNCKIQIVYSKYYYNSGITIIRGEEDGKVNAGNIKFSGRALYTNVQIAGEPKFIETRLATDASNLGTNGLVCAWDAELISALEADIVAYLNSYGGTPQSVFNILVQKPQYNKIGQAYQIAGNYNFQAGTTEDGYPIYSAGRFILPHLLTSALSGTADTSYAKLTSFAQIAWEWSVDGTSWIPADLSITSGLELWADGTIWVPGFRSAGKTYGVTGHIIPGTSTYDTVTITSYFIRATVAIPCDRRLTSSYVNGQDTFCNADFKTTIGDESRIFPSFSRSYYANASSYHRWERHDSWPTPQSVQGSTQATDNNSLRDDSNLLSGHALLRLKDVGRLSHTGLLTMPGLCFTIPVGTPIHALQNPDGSLFVIDAIVRKIVWNSTEKEQTTEFELS